MSIYKHDKNINVFIYYFIIYSDMKIYKYDKNTNNKLSIWLKIRNICTYICKHKLFANTYMIDLLKRKKLNKTKKIYRAFEKTSLNCIKKQTSLGCNRNDTFRPLSVL